MTLGSAGFLRAVPTTVEVVASGPQPSPGGRLEVLAAGEGHVDVPVSDQQPGRQVVGKIVERGRLTNCVGAHRDVAQGGDGGGQRADLGWTRSASSRSG